jgi:hypothetical protein
LSTRQNFADCAGLAAFSDNAINADSFLTVQQSRQFFENMLGSGVGGTTQNHVSL